MTKANSGDCDMKSNKVSSDEEEDDSTSFVFDDDAIRVVEEHLGITLTWEDDSSSSDEDDDDSDEDYNGDSEGDEEEPAKKNKKRLESSAPEEPPKKKRKKKEELPASFPFATAALNQKIKIKGLGFWLRRLPKQMIPTLLRREDCNAEYAQMVASIMDWLDVPGNGNCGYYCLIYFLVQHNLIEPMTVTEFRKLIRDFYILNKTWLLEQVEGLTISTTRGDEVEAFNINNVYSDGLNYERGCIEEDWISPEVFLIVAYQFGINIVAWNPHSYSAPREPEKGQTAMTIDVDADNKKEDRPELVKHYMGWQCWLWRKTNGKLFDDMKLDLEFKWDNYVNWMDEANSGHRNDIPTCHIGFLDCGFYDEQYDGPYYDAKDFLTRPQPNHYIILKTDLASF